MGTEKMEKMNGLICVFLVVLFQVSIAFSSFPCVDYAPKRECRWATPWACRHRPNTLLFCRKSCGDCVKDASEHLMDTVCYDETDKCGKLGNTVDRCYARGSQGTWMFTNCKKTLPLLYSRSSRRNHQDSPTL